MFEHTYFSPGTRVVLNGLVFNDPNSLFTCNKVGGVGGPAARYETGERVGADGSWATKSFLGSRTFELSGSHITDNAAVGDGAVSQLLNACALEDVPLTFDLASGPVTAMVRRSGDVKWERVRPGLHRWNISVVCLDGRLRVDGAAVELSTGLPYTSGGLTLPATTPWVLDSVSHGGDITFDNPHPRGEVSLRIDGFVQTPRVIVDNADGVRELSWNLMLNTGEFLDVDPAKRTSLLNGTAQRSPVKRQWFGLTTGVNTFKFRGDYYSPTAKLTVYINPSM